MSTVEEFLTELYMPTKKLGRQPVDLIHSRKMERQGNIENYFVMRFFDILERFTPKNDYSVEKFIDRFHTIISKNEDRGDISIAEIMYFIRLLGQSRLANQVAKVTGILKRDRIEELKNAMEIHLLDRIKKIMRGTSSDRTHSGVAHPIQVQERFNAMRIRGIKAKWNMRNVKRQLAAMDKPES